MRNVEGPRWKRLPWLVVLIPLAIVRASSQQSPDLQQELQQLKQEYERTEQELQGRISALELQIAERKIMTPNETKTPVSVSRLAAEQAVGKVFAGGATDVGAKFQGQLPSQPTYDLLHEAETEITGLKQQVGAFEFHGYFRSGYGLNSKGGQQAAFQAPGAGAKFRLGNEAETYGEFIFVNNCRGNWPSLSEYARLWRPRLRPSLRSIGSRTSFRSNCFPRSRN